MGQLFESEIFITGDGSHSLKLKNYEEQYHSFNGALEESNHVFIQNGFRYKNPPDQGYYILEMGLGTGLNALITAMISIDEKVKVFYDAIEAYPLSMDQTDQLNYPEILQNDNAYEYFHKIHAANNKIYQNLDNYFFFRYFREKIEDVILMNDKYHLIYFDAFSPKIQPELWTEEIFQKIYNAMKKSGVLVTYSAKGSVKRALKNVGFQVDNPPGNKGKREMTRAIKP